MTVKMTINQKIHKLAVLEEMIDLLSKRKQSAEEDIEYEKEKIAEEGAEGNQYRYNNIQNAEDRIKAYESLEKELGKLI